MTEKKDTPSVNNSIQTRLSGVMLMVLVFALGINFFIFSQIQNAVTRIDAVFSSNVDVNELSEALELVENTVYEYLNTKSTETLENYYRYDQNYKNLIEDLNDKNMDSEVKMLEKNIRRMSESYLDQTNETVQAKRGRNVEKYKTSYETENQLYEYINTYIYKLNNLRFKTNSANYQLLLSSMNVLYRLCLIVLIVVYVVGLAVTVLLVRNMIRPLTALSNTAHEVAKGNLDVPQLPIVMDDEVGVVTRSFNQMLESIRENIDQLKESMERQAQMKERELMMEAHLKEAQLKFLQAQINPHFLFNSLNAGAQLAMMEDAERTGIFVEKMADFFRYNVKKGQEDATLGEELEAVDNYIYILNVRFAGDIHFSKEVDESLENVRMPSMILQPVVENAVNHGIRDIEWEGKIHLTVTGDADYIRISVKDNGKGMTQEQIEGVLSGNREHRNEEGDSTGIGMNNVISRLELYYEESGLMEINSEGEGKGTETVIYIPVREN